MEGSVIEQIVLAHHFIAPPGWVGEEYKRIRHHHGIVWVLSGEAEYRLKTGRVLPVKAGDCLYLPAGTAYTVRCRPDCPFDHMTVNFSMRGELFPELRKLRFRTPTPFEQTFAALTRHWSLRHDFYRERCMGNLYEMTYLLLREAHSGSGRHYLLVKPARTYLDEHFQENFPLSVLPGLCGLSPTYFRRLFKEVFHETPGNYLCRLRIARARDMLVGGYCSIGEAAALCGYEDPSYFSRVFRKTMGESPSRYLPERSPD